MARVHLEALGLEFEEGGNTIWIHGSDGGTLLRIKCTGRIEAKACAATVAHADVIVQGDIAFCVPSLDDNDQAPESVH